MSFRARQPGCPCCDDDCRIDITGWNQVAGTWTITGDNLETASSNALAVTTNEHPEEKSTHYVSVKVKGDNDGDVLRVVVAFDLSTQDYLYAEIEVGSSGGFVRLFQVLSGTHTQLGNTVDVSSLPANENHVVRLCYDGTRLAIIMPGKIAYSSEVSATGTYVGVATGSIGTLATFTDFQWWIHYDDGDGYYSEPNDCPECLPICGACVSGTAPFFYKVVISGYVDGCVGSGCENCHLINGTYILEADTSIPSQVACVWRGHANVQPCGYTDFERVRVSLTHAEGSTRVEVSVGPFAGGTFTKSRPTSIDCRNLDDEDIPYNPAFSCVTCDPSTATVRVTSL